jgi:excisionase family DNA binding protein
MAATSSDVSPSLLTLDEAIAPYRGVTIPMVRAWIRRGELPAVRAGRGYLVDPADLAARLRPTLRTPPARPSRESETARAERQLREAGISTGSR